MLVEWGPHTELYLGHSRSPEPLHHLIGVYRRKKTTTHSLLGLGMQTLSYPQFLGYLMYDELLNETLPLYHMGG